MCYSLEVQLLTSLIIIASAVSYYYYYKNKFRDKEVWKSQFLAYCMMVFFFIGLHQFFEFLSLLTYNQWVYKTGLIISICSVYFLLRSLESLSKKNVYSWIALIIIVIVSAHILFSNMVFSEGPFYLSHESAFFWALSWMFLFVYWHVWSFRIYLELKDYSKRTILVYLLVLADISFILSTIYVVLGHFYFGVNVCTDAPSIWCTFYAIQVFFVPLLMNRIDKFKPSNHSKKKYSERTLVINLIIALFIIGLLLTILPFFDCLTWKYVFP
ncbi:MAG: hypothetical protein ACMXYL_00185 [Candidatus Woesearchaeota archaeon]